MKNRLMTVFITTCLISGVALADDDCTDPVSEWQPREQLRQMMLDRGWEVKRIKVDDGCYEVKGFDRKGNRVKATFSPASLKIMELKIKFNEPGDATDYLGPDNQNSPNKSGVYLNSDSNTSKNKPKITIE